MGETIRNSRVEEREDGRYLVSEITGTYEALIKNDKNEAEIHTLKKHSVKERPLPEEVDIEKALVRQAPHVIIRPSRRCRPEKQTGMEEEQTLVFGDAQVPFHDERAMKMAQVLVREMMPENIIFVGDMLDLPAQSKFAQRPEWVGQTQEAIDTLHGFYAQIRSDAPNSKIHVIHGNHEQRQMKYIAQNAAEVLNLRRANAKHELAVLSLRYLLRYDDLDINCVDGYPNGTLWLEENLKCVHGTKTKKGGFNAGSYLRDEFETTIYGHTHRIESAARTVPTSTGRREYYAASPGALCKVDGSVPGFNQTFDGQGEIVKKAEDWQQGTLLIRHEGQFHEIMASPLHERGITVDGKRYAIEDPYEESSDLAVAS